MGWQVPRLPGLGEVRLFHLENGEWAGSPFFLPSISSTMLHGIPGFGLVAAGDSGAVYLRRR